MGEVQQRVQQVRRRLNLNRFLEALVLGVLIAAAGWALVVLLERLFQFGIPLMTACAAAGGVAVLIAVTRSYLRRANDYVAAVMIDRAAGLKERVSSALAFETSSDPFARATCSDAVQAARAVHVPTHVPLHAPGNWPWTLAVVAVAVLLYGLLPQWNLLASVAPESTRDTQRQATEKKQIEIAVKETQARLAEQVKDNPRLQNLIGDLDALTADDQSDLTPEDLRRDVVKKVESATSQLRARLDNDEMKLLDALKRDLAKLETPDGDDNASKLAQALQQGDMQLAKSAMSDLKKQIDQASESESLTPEQKAQMNAMKEKLEDLSKQIGKLADNQRMQKELENKAGLTPEQAKKLLEQMKNMDPKDLQKALQKALSEAGAKISPEQLEKLARKMAENQELKQKMQDMAQAMQQAAQSCQQPGDGRGGEGQPGAAGVAGAMEMMSDLEMAEQMMNDLEAQLAELEDLKAGVCQGGNGQPGNQRKPFDSDQIGGQGPQEGLGYGAKTGKKTAAFGHKSQKVRGKLQQGEIIGQMLIDGPQLKGEVGVEAKDAIAAAQRDATEAIDRKEIPRQYWKVVREFTESMAGLAPPAEAPTGEDAPAPAEDE